MQVRVVQARNGGVSVQIHYLRLRISKLHHFIFGTDSQEFTVFDCDSICQRFFSVNGVEFAVKQDQ